MTRVWSPTTEQILDLDGVRRRIDRFRFELLNQSNDIIGEIHPSLGGGVGTPTISMNTTNDIARRLSGIHLVPDERADVNTISDRLRVIMILQNAVEFEMGTFLWADASDPHRSWGVEQQAELLDFGLMLDQQATSAVTFNRGQSILNAMVLVAHRANVEFVHIGKVSDNARRSFADPKGWQPGTTWMTMLKEMAELIGVAPPWFDRTGTLQIISPPDPRVDQITCSYRIDGQPGTRIVADSILRTSDLLKAPDDFAVFDSGTDRLRIGRYRLPESAPHSFAKRGYRVGLVESVQGLESGTAATRAARDLARNKGIAFEWLSFSATADPRHDGHNVIEALDERWLGISWRLPLTSGGQQEHLLRKPTYEPS
jgi:hypothetical protein